jgi:DNA-binding response OmpR family regulator
VALGATIALFTVVTAEMMSAARILVAEDDDAMRGLVVETLRKQGYSVLGVADGVNLGLAVSGSTGDRFDLLVSDIRLPGASGLAVLQSLRTAGRTLPVILMTAFGDEETRSRVARLDGILFDKPFNLLDLIAAVRRLLSPDT